MNFRFAVTALNPKIGEIEAYQVTNIYGKQVSSDKIDLVNCADLKDDDNWREFLSFDRIRTNLNANKILCPDVNSIEVRNQFGDDVFSYVKIEIKQCNNTIEGNECIVENESSSRINGLGVTFYKLRSIVDFTEKDPTKIVKYWMDSNQYYSFTPNT